MQAFRSQNVGHIEERATAIILNLLEELTSSVPAYLGECARKLQSSTLVEAHRNIDEVINTVQKTLNEHQQRISRLLVPFIQAQLSQGYQEAGNVSGPGTAVRQQVRAVVH